MKSKNRPYALRPSGKDYLWGGRRLNTEYAKGIPLSPLAETWECSTHPDGPSYIRGGEFDGMELAELIRNHPEYLGSRYADALSELPILVKLIDASLDLSVQVHPTDEYAKQHEGGQQGKTEMWYILDAAEDAQIVYGLRRDCSREEIKRAIETGSLGRYLNRVKVKPGEIYFMPAGTIHAIGAGCMIAEIQQNSNLTYRMYDYDRIDKDGNKRELHIDKALDVANLTRAADPRQPIRVLNYQPGVAKELLSRCRYFQVSRLILNNDSSQGLSYQSDELSYRVLLCVAGEGALQYDCEGANARGEREVINYRKGDCIFIPADSVEMQLMGRAELLDIRG